MASVMALTLLVVYNIRNRAIDRCWEIAIIAGAVTAIVTGTVCNIIFNLHFSYLAVFLSGCAAVIAGLIFEILFFSMDYTKTEYVQFEDDEYYYYVKAVPKICVSAPEKKIQHINERKTEEEEKPEEKEKPEASSDVLGRRCEDETHSPYGGEDCSYRCERPDYGRERNG